MRTKYDGINNFFLKNPLVASCKAVSSGLVHAFLGADLAAIWGAERKKDRGQIGSERHRHMNNDNNTQIQREVVSFINFLNNTRHYSYSQYICLRSAISYMLT